MDRNVWRVGTSDVYQTLHVQGKAFTTDSGSNNSNNSYNNANHPYNSNDHAHHTTYHSSSPRY